MLSTYGEAAVECSMWLNTAEVPGLGFVCTGVQPAPADTVIRACRGPERRWGLLLFLCTVNLDLHLS